MKTKTSHTPIEPSQEALLRATLRAYAPQPQSIDLEESWKIVSQRMTSLETKTSSATHLRFLPSKSPWQTRLWHKWPVLAVVAALLLLLLGTGVTEPFFHWFSGSNAIAYAYSSVSQSQQSHGITITITKGYADPDRLYIAYNAQLSSPLANKRYTHVFLSGEPHNQYMQEKGVATVGQTFACDDSQHMSGPVPCMNILGGPFQKTTIGNTGDIAFHVPASVNTLIITWSVKEVWLNGPSGQTKVSGNWSFQFSLPFHHHPQDPGLPFPTSGVLYIIQ